MASGQLPKGNAETRLVEVFSFIERGDFQQALQQAENLTRDHPNFHLAHLVRGDLLKLRYEPQAVMGQPDATQADGASAKLAALRTETQARLTALRDRPPVGHIPHQFLALSPQTRHAIAVDASRSRLYLFENTASSGKTGESTAPPTLRLIGDFFISVGKSGINKRVEGDGRTPLGAYYITSVREKKTLPEFYGAGALPINYPNALDVQRGRTGSGIWLHGSPPQQYVRAPLASDGCVVLSNPDMDRLLALVAPRTTPVVIAEQLQWVPPAALQSDTTAFATVLVSWQKARSQATPDAFAQLFDRTALTKVGLVQKSGGGDLLAHPSAQLGIAQLSLLKWQDPNDNMVATFEETVNGQATGVIRRQYWALHPEGWRLLQDTVLSGTPSQTLKRPAPKPVAQADNTQASTPPTDAQTPSKVVTAAASAPAQTQQVQQAVQAWARAWSQKNMAQYLAAYAPSFDPPGGLSRKAWEQERRDRIVSKNKITVTLSKLTTQVNGTTASVGFIQSYKADQLAVSSHKTLKLVKRGDQWLITQESVGGR
ncbi:MAG: L,D-transpeptidase family protein [Burkholderiaceae bacterium]